MGTSRPHTALTAFVLLTVACSDSTGGRTGLTSPSPAASTIQSVSDGDTVRLQEPLMGARAVRLVNIDAPELGGASQEPWASESRDALRGRLPSGTSVHVLTDRVPIDSYGRLLGIVVRGDGLDVNREQIRLGHAVTYFIWPNTDRFAQYRLAQIEAQDAGRNIWSASAPLRELPFEYRLRADNGRPFRPVGDVFTQRFVDPADYQYVHVNNRMFFGTFLEATSAGYSVCPKIDARYPPECFAPGR